jgi:hybrid cluster-associated redox disulfide protein
MKVDKNTVIGAIIAEDKDAAKELLSMGMSCVGCPASFGETVQQACFVHGIDPNIVVERLNRYFDSKENNE